MNTWCFTLLFTCALLAVNGPAGAASPFRPDVSLQSLLWGSKYVSEGRDNLDDGGIVSLEILAEWQGLAAGAWFATGDSESYEEVNLFVDYGLELGPVDAYVGYTRLEFPEDDESDNEFSAGIEVNAFPYFIPAVDYVYSTKASGSFVEVSIRSELALLDDRLFLEPYMLEGFDFGYASPGYDGPNNFQVGIEFILELSGPVALVGSAAYSWAHKDVKNDGLGDEAWMTIGVITDF